MEQKIIRNERSRFEGVFSLLLTPFDEQGRIDWNGYDRYVDWQLAQSPNGLFAVCGSSEMKWLAPEERIALAKRAVQLAGATPVVATANLQPNPDEHADELQRMAETGIRGVVLVPPNGLGTNAEALHAYFAELAAISPIPVVLYEWPQAEPYFIPAEVYGDLALRHGIVGIKDTTCTLEGIAAKIDRAPQSVVYQANTPFLLDAIRRGARGVMAVVSAAAAGVVVELWRQAEQGGEAAEALHRRLAYLDSVLRFGYPASAKYLASLQGVPMRTYCRWPASFLPENAKAIALWLASE